MLFAGSSIIDGVRWPRACTESHRQSRLDSGGMYRSRLLARRGAIAEMSSLIPRRISRPIRSPRKNQAWSRPWMSVSGRRVSRDPGNRDVNRWEMDGKRGATERERKTRRQDESRKERVRRAREIRLLLCTMYVGMSRSGKQRHKAMGDG
jgi:hypothetical protein